MKLETVHPAEWRQVGSRGQSYTIDACQRYACGALYFGRPWVNSSRYSYFESFVVPDLGIQVCAYTAIAPYAYPWDWYVDIARITEVDGVYRIHDLYLDLGIYEGRGYDVLDLNEFADALKTGAIRPDDADYALRSLHALTALLAQHRYAMERLLLARLGLQRLPLRCKAGGAVSAVGE